MITENYVSFEVAKLLKEKGFNYTVHQYYKENGEVCNNPKSVASWRIKTWCPCATLQMARKWLRETHRIDIIIEISDPSVKDRKYYCMIWDGNNNSYILDLFNSYEEAVEVAIKYCLEDLI